MGKSQSKSSPKPSKRELRTMRGGDFYVATCGALVRHLDAHMKTVQNDTINKEILRKANSVVLGDSNNFKEDFEFRIHLSNGVFIYRNGDRSMEMNVKWNGDRAVCEYSPITCDIPIATYSALQNDLDTMQQNLKAYKRDTKTWEVFRETQAFVTKEHIHFQGNYELKLHLPRGIRTYHNGDRSNEAKVQREGDRVVCEFSTTTEGDIPIAVFADLYNDLNSKAKKVSKIDTKTREILLEGQAFVNRDNRNFQGNYELKVHLPDGIITYHNGDRSNGMYVQMDGDKVRCAYSRMNTSTTGCEAVRSAVTGLSNVAAGLITSDPKD